MMREPLSSEKPYREQMMFRPACWELQWKSSYLVSACTRIMYRQVVEIESSSQAENLAIK